MAESMKAAVYYPDEGIRVDDKALPPMDDDKLLVRVGSVGICGSDIHYLKDGHIGDWWIRQPHVLGHEFSGVIADVGRDVEGFAVGDRVAVEPIIPCEDCHACRAGRYNLCTNLKFTGSPHTDGAFQEVVVTRPRFTHRIPDTMSLKQAALVEPTSIAVHAVRQSGMGLGDSVAVIGAGPIGLLTLAVARASGAGATYISDLDDFRLGKADQLGATHTINAREDAVQAIDTLSGGEGIDVVFEAVGHPKTLEDGLKMVRPGGKLVGITVTSLDWANIMLKLRWASGLTP
ncbi:MAG: alcohol dehydrogenase catalytic domain-containing protein, partial [Chloroflexota bacterium]